jgi:predicted DNA-binding protein with PD1-like motif
MKGYKFLLIAMLALAGCTNSSTMKDKTNVYALRLKPGEDLQAGIVKAVAGSHIQAGWIATAAGSLTHYNIRFANQPACI